MRIAFTVNGRPPKQRGGTSMWTKPEEYPLVVPLRKEGLKARREAGLSDCLRTLVALELKVYVPASEIESVGDLDSFLTGVSDSLQNADENAWPYLPSVFKDESLSEIDPKKPLLIENDSKVARIVAEKVPLGEGWERHYEVAIETLT